MCIACTEYAKGEIFARIDFCEGRLTCEIRTQLYVVGTADSALIREMSSIQSVLYREVPLQLHIRLQISSVLVTSHVVQWLGFCALTAAARVRFPAREFFLFSTMRSIHTITLGIVVLFSLLLSRQQIPSSENMLTFFRHVVETADIVSTVCSVKLI